jgi:hypothetical protein
MLSASNTGKIPAIGNFFAANLIADHGGGFSVPVLEGCVDNLVEADRILASMAIADATKASLRRPGECQ